MYDYDYERRRNLSIRISIKFYIFTIWQYICNLWSMIIFNFPNWLKISSNDMQKDFRFVFSIQEWFF